MIAITEDRRRGVYSVCARGGEDGDHAPVRAHAPRNAAPLMGAAALLGIIGLIASYVPARRAGALDPAEALRKA